MGFEGENTFIPPTSAWPSLSMFTEVTELSMRRMTALPLKGLGSKRSVPGMIGQKASGRAGFPLEERPAM